MMEDAVRSHTVTMGLVDALAASFPTVARLVGDGLFASMAGIYARRRQTTAPPGLVYGDDFPAFVADCDAASDLPFLADLARLELAVAEASGADAARPLDPASLAALGDGPIWSMRFVAHPAARFVGSKHPVVAIWSAHRTEPPKLLDATGPEACLVVRPGDDVRVLPMRKAEGRFAEALLGGSSILLAAAAGFDADQGFDFAAALSGVVAAGAFMRIEPFEDTTA